MDDVPDNRPEAPNHITPQNQPKKERPCLSVEFEPTVFEDSPLGNKADKNREPEDIDVVTI